jgi:hypothetical protein
VQFDRPRIPPAHRVEQRGADRPRAAAQVHDDIIRREEVRGQLSQVLGPWPGHEHPRLDRDPQPAELRPAEHQLQRLALSTLSDHGSKL